MVPVGLVVFRAEHAVEYAARARVHFAQEQPFGVTAAPIAPDAILRPFDRTNPATSSASAVACRLKGAFLRP